MVDFESDDNRSGGYLRNKAEGRKSVNESRQLVKESSKEMEDLNKKYADRVLPAKKAPAKKGSKKKLTDAEKQSNMLKMIEERRLEI